MKEGSMEKREDEILTKARVIECTLAIFCTFNPHSSTSLNPSAVLATRGGEAILISIKGRISSNSSKPGQCVRFMYILREVGRKG
jgi:hypothetical protein